MYTRAKSMAIYFATSLLKVPLTNALGQGALSLLRWYVRTQGQSVTGGCPVGTSFLSP